MPKLVDDVNVDVDVNDEFDDAPSHAEDELEAEVDAKHQLKDELVDDVGKHLGEEAARDEDARIEEPEGEDEDEDDGDEPEYEVEAIRGHEWRGKGKNKTCLYNVKWKGYPEEDNTLEPEENLEDAHDILAAYHHKIGGAPQPGVDNVSGYRVEKQAKREKSRKPVKEDYGDTADESSLPRVKRQKLENGDEHEDGTPDADGYGAWIPKGKSWEKEAQEVSTVERDPTTNDLYVLLKFKNGKKTKLKREVVHEKCPLVLLRFYEAHLYVSPSKPRATTEQHGFLVDAPSPSQKSGKATVSSVVKSMARGTEEGKKKTEARSKAEPLNGRSSVRSKR